MVQRQSVRRGRQHHSTAKKETGSKMSTDPNTRLEAYLENCEIPLSRDDWTGFFKNLDAQQLNFLFREWIERKRKWFAGLSKKNLDEKRVKDSLILALYQVRELRVTVEYDAQMEKEGGREVVLVRKMKQWEARDSKKTLRDRKPSALHFLEKNWLEPMPIFNEGEPCGYVQATGRMRKQIETFLHGVRAKPTRTLPQRRRGKPKHLLRIRDKLPPS